MSFDIKFTRLGFEKACWIARQASRCQHTFSKPCLVNLITKDTHLVLEISLPMFVSLPIRLLSPLVCDPWSSQFWRFWYWCTFCLCVVSLVRPDAWFFPEPSSASLLCVLGQGSLSRWHRCTRSLLLPCHKQQNLNNRRNYAISCSYQHHFFPNILPLFFCSENVVYFLLLLHIFKCTSDKIFSWKQTIWQLIRLFLKEQSDQGTYTVCNIGYLRT